MRTVFTLVVLALLVVALGCSAKAPEPAPTAPATAEPVVDDFDAGLADTAVEEDLGDLESLDQDLAAFE